MHDNRKRPDQLDVIFFGYHKTFDYRRIGGMDSFVRRLAFSAAKTGMKVAFVHYGCVRNYLAETDEGITLVYENGFEEALRFIGQYRCPVIVNALHRRNRLRFIRYRRNNSHRRFHMIYSVYAENIFQRALYLLESVLYPYNGEGLCLSPRLTRAVNSVRNRGNLFLPPVPSFYYKERGKTGNEGDGVIRITYLGRIDNGKGTDKFLQIREKLKEDPNFRFLLKGYYWENSDDVTNLPVTDLEDGALKIEIDRVDSWTPAVDHEISTILHHTDVLVLPYRKLSSTVDTPLLLLESMAAGVCVLVSALGDIPAVYGEGSPFVLDPEKFVEQAVEILENQTVHLPPERERVRARIQELQVSERSALDRFRSLLSTDRDADAPSTL